MKKKLKNFLIVFVIVLAIGTFAIYSFLESYIPENPNTTIGNTAGNLNNAGLFCQQDDMVYFSNAYDGGSLYSMNVMEDNIEKLNSLKCRNILIGGKFLYYFQQGSSNDTGLGNFSSIKTFSRCKLDGSKSVSLVSDVIVCGQLVGNYLYLLNSATPSPKFYKIKIDKSNLTELSDSIINPACASNGTIYYNGTEENHYLYAMNTSNDTSHIILETNLWYPVLDGDFVYYMDIEHNYRLCRYSMSQGTTEVLTNDRVDCFNVGYGYIYYQKNSQTNPQLIKIASDGSNPAVVAEGNFHNINITSQYVYFQQYDLDNIMYHVRLGDTQYTTFDKAQQAAVSQ